MSKSDAPNRVYAAGAAPDELQSMEQRIGNLINDNLEGELEDDKADELGQRVLRLVLGKFRPDLTERDTATLWPVITYHRAGPPDPGIVRHGALVNRIRVTDAEPEDGTYRIGWATLTEVTWDDGKP